MFGKINKKLGITLKVNNFCHKKNCPVGRGGFRDNISSECQARVRPKHCVIIQLRELQPQELQLREPLLWAWSCGVNDGCGPLSWHRWT